MAGKTKPVRLKTKDCLTEQQLLRKLKKIIAKSGMTMSEWSNHQRILPATTSAAFNRKQPIGRKLPAALGLTPITVFVPHGDKDIFVYPKRTSVKTIPEEPRKKKAKKK